MKFFLPLIVLFLSQPVQAEDAFDYRFYTPEVVADEKSQGEKGAVQLLWEKNPNPTRYEVEVYNGQSLFSNTGEKNFLHVMIHFNRDYQWRVREISANRTTEFSEWKPLKVVGAQNLAQREPVSEKFKDSPVEAIFVDSGE